MLELNEYTTIVIVRCNGVTIRVSVSFFAGITCCVFPSVQTKYDFDLKPLPFNMCFVHVHLEIFTILACAESFYQSQFTRRLVGSVIGTECRIYYYIITSGNWTNAAEVKKKSWRNLRGWSFFEGDAKLIKLFAHPCVFSGCSLRLRLMIPMAGRDAEADLL